MNDKRYGNFFEDFRLGQVIRHATPRTVIDADNAIYISLTGSRHVLSSAATVARNLGYPQRPLDDFLIFNIAFGKTVPEISFNAVANLGYAELRFIEPVYSGDTLRCESAVIGLKENSSRMTGVVYVRSTCYNQHDRPVLTWIRWVMVHKREPQSKAKEAYEPPLAKVVAVDQLSVHARLPSRDTLDDWCGATGSTRLWDDYRAGERIDHPLGMTIEEADHMTAARLYQNNARPHFNAAEMRHSRGGQRLVYGGHVMSVCRALSYEGLENVLCVLAVNGGQHVAPTVGGDTLFASSEIIEKWTLPGRPDCGALRIRLVGTKHVEATADTPNQETGHDSRSIVLELDYTVAMPRRP